MYSYLLNDISDIVLSDNSSVIIMNVWFYVLKKFVDESNVPSLQDELDGFPIVQHVSQNCICTNRYSLNPLHDKEGIKNQILRLSDNFNQSTIKVINRVSLLSSERFWTSLPIGDLKEVYALLYRTINPSSTKDEILMWLMKAGKEYTNEMQ